MKIQRFIVIALISITLLGCELVWTRIYSAEFFYSFAFLILSLAILGLGLGALSLRLFGFLNHERSMGIILSLAGFMSLAGPPIAIKLGIDFTKLFISWAMLGKLILTIGLLSSAFFFGGIALALMFRNYHREMPRLYMADLTGAGLGVLLAIILMNHFGTPVASFLVALPVLLAAVLSCRSWVRVVPAILIIAVFVLCPKADELLEAKRQEIGPVIYKHWDSMAKLKVFDFGEFRTLNIDNVANSTLIPFDSNYEELDTTDADWPINVGYLVDQFDSCTFLSLGAGGGADVLQALDHQAVEIHAVEVIPQVNRMMLYGDSSGYLKFELMAKKEMEEQASQKDSVKADSVSGDSANADSKASAAKQETTPVPPTVFRDSSGNIITLAAFSGRIYTNPKVKVVTEDARTYVKRFKNKFDVIFSLSSNTWAALGSGSFALAENYLYTTEAYADYWNALSDSGFMSMEHQMYVPRLVSELVDALTKLGVKEVTSHFAVYDLPQMRRKLILLSKRPLTDEIRYNAYGPLTPERYSFIHLLYPAPDSLADNLVNKIVTSGWKAASDSAAIDLSPGTDNRPFTAQLGQWKNFSWEKLKNMNLYADFMGFPLSKMIVLIIILVVVFLVTPLNLIPYLFRGDKLKAIPWLYFFAIGMGFMMLEVVLIQKYTLFIGASVYSIATVLVTLLIASGIGSRFALKVADRTAFLGIIVWLLLDILLFGYIKSGLENLTIFPRVFVSGLFIFPLGFFMGMPFTKGTLRVGELIDWGFAVNGAASVLGATLIVLVAFSYGFTIALLLGGLMYLLAYLFMSLKSAW